MKQFKNGVEYYTSGSISIHFPEDDKVCVWCPLMTSDVTKRERCGMTGEILLAPKDAVGMMCPINFVKENNHGKDGTVETV